jgi:hypothetical protein
MPPESVVVSLKSNEQDNIRVCDFRMLISPDSPINQQAINLFLHQFSAQYNTEFLDTGFFPLLRDNGWDRVQSWFFSRQSSR